MSTNLNGPQVTKDQVIRVLRKHSVDYSRWGKTRGSSLEELVATLQTKQTCLVSQGKNLRLNMIVVNLLPYMEIPGEDGSPEELLEIKKLYSVRNGQKIRRYRGKIRGISGSLKIGESHSDAAIRELREELGQDILKFQTEHFYTLPWEPGNMDRYYRDSVKYPGIPCQVASTGLKVQIPQTLYRESYIEIVSSQDGRVVRATCFGWVKAGKM